MWRLRYWDLRVCASCRNHVTDGPMSYHLSNLAWEIELRAMPKIVLLCLSHLSLQSTCECEVTVRRLSFMCGMSVSAVRTHVEALVSRGLVDEIGADGRTFYRVKVAARDEQQ